MKKTIKTILWIVIILIIIGGIWYGVSKKPVAEKEVIKIGAMLMLSGEGAAWGQASQRGIELAVNEVNENSGINGKKIKMIYEDTQGRAPNAVSAYEKLTKIDKVRAIIGPLLQTEVSAIAPLTDKDKFPVIAPSYTPIVNRPNPRNPLLIWLDPTIEAEQMAEYVYNQGVRTISVLGTQDSWEKEVSTAFANKFESLDGAIYFKDLLKIDETDVKTVILKTIKDDPDAVFLGTYFQFLNLTRVLNEFGYQGELYSIEVDEYLANESKSFTSGLQFISSDLYRESFRIKYEEIYKEKSNIPAGQSYDAMNILISFLRDDPTQEDLLNTFESFKKYEGVSGVITITEDNKTIIPTAIYELENGAIKKIETIKNGQFVPYVGE
ncbi:penicillin-binding protein activator [Candidatus Parcubacteria bacterium]|nr:penicillin-binding protein activator [Patescibacteria group bacterium]MCG2687035.1 penicillin-binding protein activator [Candidatus Parcubacteria bacterium]